MRGQIPEFDREKQGRPVSKETKDMETNLPIAYIQVDDSPVNGAAGRAISSNWAYDHVAAADPHTVYRLESEDHSHQSTGLQAGQLDHGLAMVAASLLDDDHTQYILKSLFDAHTILIAISDDTPIALTVDQQAVVGRITGGNIVALTGAQLWTILTGQAAAAVSMNGQNFTDLGSLVTDTGTPRDLPIDCGANKTVLLNQTVYDDVQFSIASGKEPAANFPSWEAFTANTKEYAFSVGDLLYLQTDEAFHSWKVGTAGLFHLHFCPKTDQATGANRFAKFTINIAYADVDEVWTETSLTAEYTIPTGTLALTHLYLAMGSLALTNNIVGTQFKVTVTRIAATGGTEYADDVYITQIGIHLQQDTLGSRQEHIK